SLGYPQEERVKLIHSLKQGDYSVADEALQDIFRQLSMEEIPLFQLKCVCFDIINAVIKTASELEMIEKVGDLEKIADFKSLRQLEKELRDVSKEVCRGVQVKTESNSDRLREDIRTYIQKNYNQYHLSLEDVASVFNLSTPYLSKFIKEQFGKSFTHYVFGLRMEEVKKQLLETNKLIKEIIFDVGYRDVSNFTREFKKVEGVTPGQYRKLNKK